MTGKVRAEKVGMSRGRSVAVPFWRKNLATPAGLAVFGAVFVAAWAVAAVAIVADSGDPAAHWIAFPLLLVGCFLLGVAGRRAFFS